MISIKRFLIDNRKRILTVILIMIFLITAVKADIGNGIFHKGGYNTLKAMMVSLFNPDLSMEIVMIAIKSCWQTFSYALISISLAVIIALPLAVMASGTIFRNRLLIVLVRGIIGFLRAVHELVWAWIFVAAVGLTPIGAIFALAIPYAGYFGKIFADILIETPKAPLTALKLSGAERLQIFFYGYLPSAFPNMFSYVIYRLECAIRSSSVLSFVGLGGIGFQIQISLQDLKYNQVWTFMLFLICMILIIDKWGYEIRRRVK